MSFKPLNCLQHFLNIKKPLASRIIIFNILNKILEIKQKIMNRIYKPCLV